MHRGQRKAARAPSSTAAHATQLELSMTDGNDSTAAELGCHCVPRASSSRVVSDHVTVHLPDEIIEKTCVLHEVSCTTSRRAHDPDQGPLANRCDQAMQESWPSHAGDPKTRMLPPGPFQVGSRRFPQFKAPAKLRPRRCPHHVHLHPYIRAAQTPARLRTHSDKLCSMHTPRMTQWCSGCDEGSRTNIRKFVEWPVVASTPAAARAPPQHACAGEHAATCALAHFL